MRTSKHRYPIYVNVYEYFQKYGGPEEGGWWYWCRAPEESVKVRNRRQLKKALRVLRKKWYLDKNNNYTLKNQWDHPEFDRVRNRGATSAAGGEDYGIRIENHPGEFSPKERPHYE